MRLTRLNFKIVKATQTPYKSLQFVHPLSAHNWHRHNHFRLKTGSQSLQVMAVLKRRSIMKGQKFRHISRWFAFFVYLWDIFLPRGKIFPFVMSNKICWGGFGYKFRCFGASRFRYMYPKSFKTLLFCPIWIPVGLKRSSSYLAYGCIKAVVLWTFYNIFI